MVIKTKKEVTDERLLCQNCHQIGFEGKISICCNKLFCKYCRDCLLHCPNCSQHAQYKDLPLSTKSKINQTKASCRYQSRGCDKYIPLNKYRTHIEKCPWKMEASRHIVGIDLGTTMSSVGVYIEGNLITIPNEIGEPVTPSVIYYEKSTSKVHVGHEAVSRGRDDPEGLVFGVKRAIGEIYNPSLIPDNWTFTLEEGENHSCLINARGRKVTPEKVSSLILKSLKASAERFLGDEVKRAVITVPAHFTDSQRRATITAAKLAGLEVEMLLNEPTAAAMCYYHSEVQEEDTVKNFLIFDLGGGTLDITIVEIQNEEATVLAISGDSKLGGVDFDGMLANELLRKFKTKYPDTKRTVSDFLADAEKIKIELSSEEYISYPLRNVDPDLTGIIQITRGEFEECCAPLFDRCVKLVQDLLATKSMSANDIQDVILAGGSSHIPAIVERITNIFGKTPLNKIDPSEAIVTGASISGALRNPLYVDEDSMLLENLVVSDICAHTLGLGCRNPDGGHPCDTPLGVLQDVTVMGIIDRFTTIPCCVTKEFPDCNGESTSIIIFEGESENPNLNTQLGYFVVNTPGEHKDIEVTFEYDDSGSLNVSATSAVDKQSAKMELSSKKSGINLASHKELKDASVSVDAIRKGEVNIECHEDKSGISELEVFIVGEVVHLQWKIEKKLKENLKSFSVMLNEELHEETIHRIRSSSMEYIMKLPSGIQTDSTFKCKVKLTTKKDEELPWSPVVEVEYYPTSILEKKSKTVLSTACSRHLLKVFGQSYGKNPQFWATLKLFSKTLVTLRAAAKKKKKSNKPHKK